jgi:hypothetical protein
VRNGNSTLSKKTINQLRKLSSFLVKTVAIMAIVGLVLLDVFIGMYFYFNSEQIASFLSNKQTNNEQWRQFTLYYPPSPSVDVMTVINSTANGTGEPPPNYDKDMRIEVLLLHYSPSIGITEGQENYLSFHAFFVRKNITSIWVGFGGCSPYGMAESTQYLVPYDSSEPLAHLTYPNGTTRADNDYFIERWSRSNAPIYWKVSGDYHPIVRVVYDNWTTVTQSYPDILIHVNSMDDVEQRQQETTYNQISLWITVALFVFSFIGSIELVVRIRDIFLAKSYRQSNQYSTYNKKTNTNHWQPIKWRKKQEQKESKTEHGKSEK